MGLNLGMFKTPRHRVFDYQPLYYDERKEALDEKIENARRKKSGEYVPGEGIRGSFKRINIDVKRSKSNDPVKRIITLITLAIFMMALVFIARHLGLLF
ncbi:MAG: hypothetical protein RSC28_04290 [Bacteroidales bacterium]